MDEPQPFKSACSSCAMFPQVCWCPPGSNVQRVMPR